MAYPYSSTVSYFIVSSTATCYVANETTSAWVNQVGWVQQQQQQQQQQQPSQDQLQQQQPSQDQLQQAERVTRERLRAKARERAATHERAEALLLSVLDEVQKTQWEARKEVDVVGSAGRTYRLTRARQGGVYRLGPRSQRTHELCIHHDFRIPIEDQIAAQKLQLETDEAEFCRIANETSLLEGDGY
jgi:hypothetical protein